MFFFLLRFFFFFPTLLFCLGALLLLNLYYQELYFIYHVLAHTNTHIHKHTRIIERGILLRRNNNSYYH